MNLPKDPVILLSMINMLLRDKYSSLEALCEAEDVNKDELVEKLAAINYCYNYDGNQFI